MQTYHFDRHPLGSDWELPFTLNASNVVSQWNDEDIVEVGLRGGGAWDDYGYHQDDAFSEWVAPATKVDPHFVAISIPGHALSTWGPMTLDLAVRWRNGDARSILLKGRLPVW